ncbi:MAG: SusC/RagA family TonB-linked outer membrane protein [Cyclobacteriaceae bacterium]|nr:SusC/RagA family TonB-linked outer membrane protein [Cyclobacteriaceae bacterium]
MKKFLLLCFSLAFVASVYAQERTVNGRVTSAEDGSPLPGVNVLLKGSSVGTVTDANGSYSLPVPQSGGVLTFSFIGLRSEDVPIGDRSTVDVSLALDVTQLGEVVVTAQGIQQEKRALGYAVTTIDNTLIANRPEQDVSRILQGKIPGVNVTSTSGVSGTGTNIIIRGYSSITGSNQPLFVVDGVPFNSNTNSQTGFAAGGVTTSSRMLDLDPNSIESVSVLKGLSATVLYGDQGRNGVILVTTKAGGKVAKQAEVTVSQSFFQNRIASLPRFQNNYGGGFQQLTPEAWFFSTWGANFADQPTTKHPIGVSSVAFIRNAFPEFAIDPSQPWGPSPAASLANVVDYDNIAYPDIGESFFRKGNVATTSVQVSGSRGTTGYNASIGYSKEEGFTPNNDLEKINFGLGINSAISDKFNIKSSFQYANTDMTTPPLNAGFGSNSNAGIPSTYANVLYTPRNVDLGGLPWEHPVDKSSVYFRGGNDITNPLWLVRNYANTSVVNRFFNATSFNYDINEKFTVSYRLGLDTYNEVQEVKYNKGGGAGVNINVLGGIYNSTSITNTIWNHDLMLSYKTKLTDQLGLSALVGANNRFDKYEQFGVSSTGQVAFGLFNHSNFGTSSSRNILDGSRMNFLQEERRAGFYGNVTLDYADYLYVNLLARNDWTSTVETQNQRILYPGASVSFVPTSAFDMPDFFDMLKVRGGFGTSAGFPAPYSTRNILSQNTRAFADAAGAITISQTIGDLLGNPNLKPELQQEFEFGVEGTMLKGRLSVDLSLYQRETKDLITRAPIDPATGYTSTRINIGSLETKGIDLIVSGTPVKTSSGFTWEAIVNFGRYRSIIQDLGDSGLDEVVFSGFTNLGNFAIPGQPYGLIKGIGIERHANGEKIVLSNGRYKETAAIVELGDPNPAFTSSIINNLTYKNFRLSFMFEYRHKGVIVSNTVKGVLARGLSNDTDQLDRALTLILPGVQEDGTKNNVQVTASNYFFDNYFFTDEAVTFDGSTARLREASLSYMLPKSALSKTPFKAASITLTGSNIWFRALNMPKGVNFDTDVLSTGVGNGLGFDYLTGPSARRFGGTISLTF